ncbi:hypothetical protein ACEPAI_4038 [Sanghuangporus weigelae]
MPPKRRRVQVSLTINNESRPAQIRKADQYFDRTYTKALVRKGDTIETLLYYTLDGRVYVKNGEKDITIVEATTGQTRTSSADKEDFVKHDPDLKKKTGNFWTCGGKKLRSELKENMVPENEVPQGLTIGTKKGRRIVFEEDRAGVIREVFDDGDCVAVEEGRAAAKKRRLFDHPLLVVPC